jgi:hypothetical protein
MIWGHRGQFIRAGIFVPTSVAQDLKSWRCSSIDSVTTAASTEQRSAGMQSLKERQPLSLFKATYRITAFSMCPLNVTISLHPAVLKRERSL